MIANGRTVVLLMSVGLLVCAGVVQAQQTSTAPKSELAQVAAANNLLALDLYRKAVEQAPGKNVFFSPASISTALSMTYEGSAGATRTQMAKVLAFNLPDAARRKGTAELLGQLTAAPGKHYQLSVANALWGDERTLLPAFVKTMEATYHGGVQPMDFGGKPVSIVEAVNSWAASHTNDKIKDLLHPEDIDGLTRLILTNAIYFKGNWEKKFVAINTADEDFHLSNGKTVKAPLMKQKEFVGYMEDDTLQAVELPYQDGDLSMIVVLPKGKIADLDGTLSDARLTMIRSGLQREEVRIALPKFTFSSRTYLDKTLAELGMPDAFAEGIADFSGMTGGKLLYIKHVIHEAFIAVNEEGSEAAGATAVVMSTRAAHIDMSKEFKADRPFVFSIVQKSSGAILFMGKVEEPRQ